MLLYPFIPTLQGDFSSLLKLHHQHLPGTEPASMLNAVINPTIKIYDFDKLRALTGPGGFDVLELDMSFLGFLVGNKLITPVTSSGNNPFPVAVQAVTLNGETLYVPSWMCSNFDFYFGDGRSAAPKPRAPKAGKTNTYRPLVSDFDGGWTITAMYIMAYVQMYGYDNLNKAFTMPPDFTVIEFLYGLTGACQGPDGNPCIDGTFHNGFDGMVERAFATRQATTEIGFAERSFFINYYDTQPGKLQLFPAYWVWPSNGNLLVYTDGFVNNSSTCASGTCPADAQAFTNLMTSTAMKTYIAFRRNFLAERTGSSFAGRSPAVLVPNDGEE